ncbi:MAG TPA: D-glucuronyl C5-epimerase family protein [Methylomirabilota bacterium]
MRNELLGFRFRYPVEAVPEARAKDSLRYHVHSERLFFDAMDLDADGVPRQCSRIFGIAYNPAYVAWYGLMALDEGVRTSDLAHVRRFLNQVHWLERNAVIRDDEAVWRYSFDWREGRCDLKAPWISALAQGLAMSALVRAVRVTGRKELLDLARAATRVFERGIEEGGVATREGHGALYEEYPGRPLPRILDGFLFSLLGLYDVAVETDDAAVWDLFRGGVRGLIATLRSWDYRGKWSWYGSHGYLCPPQYHGLNCALLESLARLTGDPVLARYAESWAPARIAPWDKLEILTVFLVTKNWARVRFGWGGR